MTTDSDPDTRGFTIETPGIDVTVNPGGGTVVELRDLLAGAYTFICRRFGTRSS